MSGKNCEVLEHVFTFYTVANNPQVENLKSRILTILDNGNEINSEVRFVLPFLAGHSVWFTMGKYYVEDHINFLKNVILDFIWLVSFLSIKYAPNKKTIIEKKRTRDFVFKKAVNSVPIKTPITTKIP